MFAEALKDIELAVDVVLKGEGETRSRISGKWMKMAEANQDSPMNVFSRRVREVIRGIEAM